MFTGIVKEIGMARRCDISGYLYRLEISCGGVYDDAGIGDSVSVNGVCLTVTKKSGGVLFFDVMSETIRKTAMADLKAGETVNLESSLRAGASIGGHFVQGHIDCVGTVRSVAKKSDESVIEVGFPKEFGHLLVEKGSVAIDGVSLTVVDALPTSFKAGLIPHTLKSTTLGQRKTGDNVNLEFDIIGKYIAKLNGPDASGITEEFLKSRGF